MKVNDIPTFPSNSALGRALRVKLSGSNLVVADSTDDELGTLIERTLASDPNAAVLPIEYFGVREHVAAAAFAQYATVYAADGGKIDDSGTLIRGLSLEAASGDGSIVRVLTQRASITGTVDRSNLVQDDLAEYDVPLTSCKVHNALHTDLPATAADDDAALITGTPGTDAPTIQGVDFGGTTSDEKFAFEYQLPPEYVDGQSVSCRVRGGMLTTVADDACTVDVEAWKADGDGAVGSDLCATSALSINSLTKANKDFTITPTGLAAGDKLIIRVSFAGNDSGDAGVMVPEISKLSMLLDIKG